MLEHLAERHHGKGLQDQVIDEEVGGGGQGCPDKPRNAAWVVQDIVQLGEYGAPQHGSDEDVEHGPQEEEGGDSAVHGTEAGAPALAQGAPAAGMCTYSVIGQGL